MATSDNKYDTKVKKFHNSVIKGFKEIGAIGATDTTELNSFESLDKTHFTEINNPTVSSQNGYNTTLSFSKKNIHAHIGFSKSIAFGDSCSIRHGSHQDWNVGRKVNSSSKKTDPEHTTFVSSNTANFTLGNSDSTTHADFKSSKYNKGICYLQKGTTYNSRTSTGYYNKAKIASQGNYYKIYATNTITQNISVAALVFDFGLVSFAQRWVRYNTYLANFNMNDFLASSRIVHLFLTGYSNNTRGKRVTRKLHSHRKGWSKVLARLYSKEYCVFCSTETFNTRNTNTTASLVKVIASKKAAIVLKANCHTILG